MTIDKSNLCSVSREFRLGLAAEIKRTGVTPRQFLKRLKNQPEGLATRTITRWLSGEVRQAEKSHVDYVLRHYAKLPDRQEQPARGKALKDAWIELSAPMVAALRSELKRSGLSVPQAAKLSTMPATISAHRLNNWKRGTVKRVEPQLWSAIIATLAAQPDANPVPSIEHTKPHKAPRVTKANVDWEVVDALRAHKQRTRIGARQLLADWGDDKPPGINEAMLNSWLRGRIAEAAPTLLAAVMQRYEGLPDC